MPNGRTRKQCIKTLEERLAWLRRKAGERRDAGQPWTYLVDEVVALEWVLPMAREALETLRMEREQ